MYPPLDITTASATDIGKERTENQDSLGFFGSTPLGPVWVICDGMGGSAGGKTASALAVETIGIVVCENESAMDGAEVGRVLCASAERANKVVFDRAQGNAELQGMGTTMVGLAIKDRHAYVAHVGDSRLYLIRKQQIRKLTKDHTLVQDLVEKGVVSIEEAKTHPHSHILSDAIGVKETLKVVVTGAPLKIRAGDHFVMCTDGLTGQVDDQAILAVASTLEPQEACDRLVELANENGGPDNITVQIIRVNSIAAAVNAPRRRWLVWCFAAGLVIVAGTILWQGLGE